MRSVSAVKKRVGTEHFISSISVVEKSSSSKTRIPDSTESENSWHKAKALVMAFASSLKELAAELIPVLTDFVTRLTTANITPVAFLVKRNVRATHGAKKK